MHLEVLLCVLMFAILVSLCYFLPFSFWLQLLFSISSHLHCSKTVILSVLSVLFALK